MSTATASKNISYPAIKGRDFQRQNVTGSFWVAIIPKDHTLEDVKRPEYWAHVADSTFMGEYNEITCKWEDGMEVAKLYVRDYTSVAAAVEVMFHKNYRESDDVKVLDVVERYSVAWADPKRRHVITDTKTGTVVKEGIQSKVDAEAFVQELINK